MNIKEINSNEALLLIKTRKPEGLFIIAEPDGYVGIDNSTGDAWTEFFRHRRACVKWLCHEL